MMVLRNFATLREEFEDFARSMVPDDADPEQFKDVRVAFYAGAITAAGTLGQASRLPPPLNAELQDRLATELEEFVASMGHAPGCPNAHRAKEAK